MADDIDFIDDILPKKPTTVQALGKFRPKAHSKTTKGASIPFQTSSTAYADASNLDSPCKANAPVEGLSLPSSCVTDSFDATHNQNTPQNVGVPDDMASKAFASVDINLDFKEQSREKVGDATVRLASGDDLQQLTTNSELHNSLDPLEPEGSKTLAAAEKCENDENTKASGTELDIPALELQNCQDPPVPEGPKTLDERYVVFQLDDTVYSSPEKQKEEGMLIASAFEPIDDIFHTDAVRKAGRFQPKPASQHNKAKAKKSVSFDLPCSSDSRSRANPLTVSPPDMQLMTDVYTDNNSQSPLTTSDLTDNYKMDEQNPTDEDISEQLMFEGFSNILSQPSSVSDAVKFQPDRVSGKWDVGDVESSCSIYAMEAESLEGSLVKDTGYADDLASGILDMSALTSLQFTSTDHNGELENISETADFQYEFDEGDLDQNLEMSKQDAGEEMHSPIIGDIEDQRYEELTLSEILEGINAGRSHKKLRKRVNRQGTQNTKEKDKGDSNVEDSNISRMDEDGSDGEWRVDVAKSKKIQRKTKGAKSGHVKTAKQKGKTSKKLENTEVEQKKKFPHSTKRKRRQVDKVLLETPEYELNLKQIAIKDLILLGEAKERILNKEASTKNSAADKRIEETSHDDFEENPTHEPTKYVNYGSYSNRVHAPRWSKSETELLYKAIRQFGTDFAMIQQLFPNRTRHQVKLKFKNEERKHPLLVHDALLDRSSDLSHLKQVIEKLRANKEHKLDEIEFPSTTVFEDANSDDEEERTEIQKYNDVINENVLGGEVKSPENSGGVEYEAHSGGVEYEAESPTDFDDYQSAWD